MTDPHEWLEDVEGERALDQVRAWNAATLGRLQADPRYAELETAALAILEASDKVPYGQYRRGRVYNFWQDATHVRGLIRHADLDSYLGDGTADWSVLIDIDALAEADGENWVYHGLTRCEPDNTRAMLSLSRGGKDASPLFEWDLVTGERVPDGFALPEAKSGVAWEDPDTLLVATDWGDGTTTESGYPFVVKRWRRGEPLESATEVFRGEPTHVGVFPGTLVAEDGRRIPAVWCAETFFEQTVTLILDDRTVTLPLPRKLTVHVLSCGQLVFSIEEDWTVGETTHTKGTLLGLPIDSACAGTLDGLEAIRVPGDRETLAGVGHTASRLLVTCYVDVRGQAWTYRRDDDGWHAQRLPLSEMGSVSLVSAYADSDIAFFATQSFLEPDTLVALDVTTLAEVGRKAAPARFDTDGLVSEQREAVSPDGTRVPYFLVRRADAEGPQPTLLYGYGGFQVSLTPSYAGVRGKLWLERGGALAIANIRGGGEFGPGWHQAALKGNRQRAYDDMIAVAEQLIADGVTEPRRMAVMGGSNGGLLVGVMYVQRPDLWNGVICQVPLLDMLRYHTLLAGASWIGEYGDPRIPEERAFLETISPYHTVAEDGTYPEIFFVTSTKDDRVHPGHARKMAARLESWGHAFAYYENIDGGHSAAANLKETARRSALEYVWLTRKLVD